MARISTERLVASSLSLKEVTGRDEQPLSTDPTIAPNASGIDIESGRYRRQKRRLGGQTKQRPPLPDPQTLGGRGHLIRPCLR